MFPRDDTDVRIPIAHREQRRCLCGRPQFAYLDRRRPNKCLINVDIVVLVEVRLRLLMEHQSDAVDIPGFQPGRSQQMDPSVGHDVDADGLARLVFAKSLLEEKRENLCPHGRCPFRKRFPEQGGRRLPIGEIVFRVEAFPHRAGGPKKIA